MRYAEIRCILVSYEMNVVSKFCGSVKRFTVYCVYGDTWPRTFLCIYGTVFCLPFDSMWMIGSRGLVLVFTTIGVEFIHSIFLLLYKVQCDIGSAVVRDMWNPLWLARSSQLHCVSLRGKVSYVAALYMSVQLEPLFCYLICCGLDSTGVLSCAMCVYTWFCRSGALLWHVSTVVWGTGS